MDGGSPKDGEVQDSIDDPPDGDDDLIFEGEWLTIRAMKRRDGTRPAKQWADGLQKKGKGQLLAAARIVETTLRSGRPPAGRIELIPGSRHRLSELKVTSPGSTPPHLRLLFLRRERALWAAIGFTKQKNELTRQEIEAGDSVTSEWLAGDKTK